VARLSDYASARRLRDAVLELVVVRSGRTLTLWAGDAAQRRRDTASVNCATIGRA
jgi:hypothetical protein